MNVVQVHTRGVRDGLLLTMVQQSPTPPAVPAEDRRAAVEEFAKNCGVDLPHARQVARIAGSLWQQLAAPLGLKPEDRELIESAALIANVGYLINFEGHHKHSYHLIVNSELPGFERRQLQILANVARYHRGTRPKQRHENFGELSLDDQQRVSALAAILRLALALDRTHQQNVAEVRARVRDDVVRIVIQSQGDTDVDLWAAERKVDLFEKVFGRKVRFSARDTARRPSTWPAPPHVGPPPNRHAARRTLERQLALASRTECRVAQRIFAIADAEPIACRGVNDDRGKQFAIHSIDREEHMIETIHQITVGIVACLALATIASAKNVTTYQDAIARASQATGR